MKSEMSGFTNEMSDTRMKMQVRVLMLSILSLLLCPHCSPGVAAACETVASGQLIECQVSK